MPGLTAGRCTASKVLFLAGVGITPLRALFETLPGQVTLVHRARRTDDLALRGELDATGTEPVGIMTVQLATCCREIGSAPTELRARAIRFGLLAESEHQGEVDRSAWPGVGLAAAYHGAMDEIGGVEVVAFANSDAFEGWLADHHARHDGVWVKVAKKGSGIASVTADELVDVGLCWGWISGQRRSLDASYYLQKYVPRRPKSLWSQVNVDKVAVLAAAGRMREPGLAEVRKAQADGRWAAAYAPQSTAAVPDELAAALAEDIRAANAFSALDKTAKYLVLLPLLQARTPEGRQVAVERAVRALAADG